MCQLSLFPKGNLALADNCGLLLCSIRHVRIFLSYLSILGIVLVDDVFWSKSFTFLEIIILIFTGC